MSAREIVSVRCFGIVRVEEVQKGLVQLGCLPVVETCSPILARFPKSRAQLY